MDASRSDRDLRLPALGLETWCTRRHAFSLPAQRRTETRGQAGATRGWRCLFGELWSELALQSAVASGEPQRTSKDVLHDARVITSEAGRQLGWVLAVPADAAHVAPPLRCAAALLEACATLWSSFGSAGGDRHVHLLRRLEERLGDTERERMCAERGHDIPAVAVPRASRRARKAMRSLAARSEDRAGALAAYEDATVELAVIAVRIAINIQRLGAPNPFPRPAPARLRRPLQKVMVEVLAAAREEDRCAGDSTRRGAGLWLGRAISATPPLHEVVDLAEAPDTDPVLRAESLLTVRSEWVRLGAVLTLVIVELDDLLSRPRSITWPEIGASTAGEAARAVHAAGLEACPAAFDHRAAWGFQREALGMIVGDFCLALQTCDEPLLRRTRTTVSRRLSRVAVATWSLDHQLGGRPARRPPSAT